MENPTRLTITKARVRNFFSYGNEWQEVTFKKGLTLVQGFNVDTGKSNGSGKSSITEIIPFALFGKTIKELPQNKIINWNNRSACEVQLFFDRAGKSYVFKRGLKPNKFKVTVDGLDVVRSADIRAFQAQMEEEVIGMDFKTFKNLIYFSPNNTLSILSAGKEQKRLFLESLFDLSEYSGLLKLTNEKIRIFSDRVKETETLKAISTSLIAEKTKDIEGFDDIDLGKVTAQLNTDTNKLDILKSAQQTTTVKSTRNYDLIKEHLKTLQDNHTLLSNTIVEKKTKISHIQKEIDNTDLGEITAKVDKLKGEITTLEASIEKNKPLVEQYGIDNPVILETIETLSTKKANILELITTQNQNIALKEQTIQTCINTIEKYENADQLEGDSECPLCKSKVDHDHIASWYIYEIDAENHRMKRHQEELEDMKKVLLTLQKSQEDVKWEAKGLIEQYRSQQTVISNNIDDYFSLEQLRKNLTMLPDVEALKSGLEEKVVTVETLKAELSDAEWKYSLNIEDIQAKQLQVDSMDESKKKSEALQTEINSLIETIRVTKDNLLKLSEIKKKQDEQIKSKKNDIDKHTKSIVVYDNDVRKFNKMLDHLNYMRTALKDENVKQFAISALLPYLNHRANHYLSESGFPYMVSIDGWLEVVIRGMGTEDVGYNSLSGGESKAMDMAVQLACNDIAELQAKTSISIAIYDEILDTSLDADGVQKLMDIVRVKQGETDSCVLCITHRDEIKELEFDNSIIILKKGGFSSIQH